MRLRYLFALNAVRSHDCNYLDSEDIRQLNRVLDEQAIVLMELSVSNTRQKLRGERDGDYALL